MIHYLKTVEPYFTAVTNGEKNFELRQYTEQGPNQPARDFRVGDTVFLFQAPNGSAYVGRKIAYVLKDTDPCMEGRLPPGYCILGLRVPAAGIFEKMQQLAEDWQRQTRGGAFVECVYSDGSTIQYSSTNHTKKHIIK